jgi:hypothetical protein
VVTAVSGIGAFAVTVQDTHDREWARGIDREAGARVIASAQHPVAGAAGGSRS